VCGISNEPGEEQKKYGDGDLEVKIANRGAKERQSEAEIEQPFQLQQVLRGGVGENPIADQKECGCEHDQIVGSEMRIDEDCGQKKCGVAQ